MTQRPKSQGRMLYPGVVLYGGELMILGARHPTLGKGKVRGVSPGVWCQAPNLVDKPVDRKKKSVASLHKRTV